MNHPGPDGLTPLMVAARLGKSQTVELLLTAGAQPMAIEPRMGVTALHKAAQSGNADTIRVHCKPTRTVHPDILSNPLPYPEQEI